LRPSETAVCKGLVEGDGGKKEGDRRGEGRRKEEGGRRGEGGIGSWVGLHGHAVAESVAE
jgi:hypothetical protein